MHSIYQTADCLLDMIITSVLLTYQFHQTQMLIKVARLTLGMHSNTKITRQDLQKLRLFLQDQKTFRQSRSKYSQKKIDIRLLIHYNLQTKDFIT
jgi:hypothetical protein